MYHHPKRGPCFGYSDLRTLEDEQGCTSSAGDSKKYYVGNTSDYYNNLTKTRHDKYGVTKFDIDDL